MTRRIARLSIILLALALQFAAAEELTPLQGLNALPEKEPSQLSQQDGSPLAVKALGIRAELWKHAETAHFIYHYRQSHVATPISVEAEFHYRVIVKELARDDASPAPKAHIYIFEKPEDWEVFQFAGQLEPWTGGIQSGNSLFIVRDPSYRFSDNSLGHEIVHLLLRRFYGTRVPLWLNEGFAQYASKNAHASFQRARGYLAKPSSNSVARENLFALSKLALMSYPPAAQVDTFYDQSERLVRFLVAADRAKFIELLGSTATGEAFETALSRTNSTMFPTMAALEEKFIAYATKDSISLVQDR